MKKVQWAKALTANKKNATIEIFFQVEIKKVFVKDVFLFGVEQVLWVELLCQKIDKMNNYGLNGCLLANKGQGQELANILIQAAELLKNVEGCFLYMISTDLQNPDCIWITERWSNREAHDNSLKIPKIQELIKSAMPLLAEMPKKGISFTVLGGVGVDI